MIKHRFKLRDIVKAIKYAHENGEDAGICGHPAESHTRMYSRIQPFVGKSVSLWVVPFEWRAIVMSKAERLRRARVVKAELDQKYNQ